MSEFSSWASVKADESLNMDWDDVEGNTRRRLEGLKLEKVSLVMREGAKVWSTRGWKPEL